MMRKRFVLLFIRQWLTVGILTAICFIAMIYWMASKMLELDLQRNFSTSVLESIMNKYSVREDGTPNISPAILRHIESSGGWLQVLDENGQATFSYLLPDDVPNQYAPGQLMNYLYKYEAFPYKLYILIGTVDGSEVTLLYGTRDPLELAAKALADGNSVPDQAEKIAVQGEKQKWPEEVELVIEQYGAGIQLLNAEGVELMSYGLADSLPKKYTPQELVLRKGYPERYGFRLEMRTEKTTGRIWLIHAPFHAQTGVKMTWIGPIVNNELQLFIFAFGSFALILVLACCILAVWQGNKFGKPILHVMSWLSRLPQHHYDEPEDRSGRPRSKGRSGKLRFRFRPFAEVIDAVQSLATELERHELERQRNERMREEWIAGLSHDLKTPLSSILGYSQLLRSKQYEWKQEEVREFSEVMVEKAEYMDELIHDLNLLYRLKQDPNVLRLELYNMNEIIEGAVQRIVEDQQWSDYKCIWTPTPKEIFFELDPVAFRRMLDNIIVNALLHNPAGTQVNVDLQEEGDDYFSVTVQDNGIGIDKEAQEGLFQRYYRGTDTEHSSSGSGLGMAIAKEIAEAHGGYVEVESSLGKGTAIRLIFNKRRKKEQD